MLFIKQPDDAEVCTGHPTVRFAYQVAFLSHRRQPIQIVEPLTSDVEELSVNLSVHVPFVMIVEGLCIRKDGAKYFEELETTASCVNYLGASEAVSYSFNNSGRVHGVIPRP